MRTFALIVLLNVLLAAAPDAAPAAGGYFTGVTVTTNTANDYAAWVDGQGPSYYYVGLDCRDGTQQAGAAVWAGDRRGSSASCACCRGAKAKHIYLWPKAGYFVGAHITSVTPTQVTAWFDGNGPDTYETRLFCDTLVRPRSGAVRWAGDRRGSTPKCPAKHPHFAHFIVLTDK